jgi:transcriptional pleiotropic regulator of transition state genes
MKSTGMTRPIDHLGRVVIPIEIRESLNIKPKDLLEISVQGNKIVLKRSSEVCIFCDNTKDLVDFADKKVCSCCINKLTNK